ncbi:MAG: hypothetical protein HYV09_38450 [Deltaproteobacteria bacterium]|nr:hypothetical protein [Deltaproteobacteria bacterium]
MTARSAALAHRISTLALAALAAACSAEVGVAPPDPIAAPPLGAETLNGGNVGPGECATGCYRSSTTTTGTQEICSWSPRSPLSSDRVTIHGQLKDRDIAGKHRLFVHGLHGDSTSWQMWIEEVQARMQATGHVTTADQTGDGPDGPGSAPLLAQATELAIHIVTNYASVPDNSVSVYAHSMGALKVQAVLQLGYSQPGSHFGMAARKLGQITIFQGAHGGCDATEAIGDVGAHGAHSCDAAKDIGHVNDARVRPLLNTNTIPGTSDVWKMNKILWTSTSTPKTIRYVRAWYDGANNGGAKCKGAEGSWKTSWICRESELLGGGPNDGVVYTDQMAPTWWDDFASNQSAGRISVIDYTAGNSCHMRVQDSAGSWVDDTHVNPKRDMGMLEQFIGKDPAFPHQTCVTESYTTTTPAYCDLRCHCRAQPTATACVGPTRGETSTTGAMQ